MAKYFVNWLIFVNHLISSHAREDIDCITEDYEVTNDDIDLDIVKSIPAEEVNGVFSQEVLLTKGIFNLDKDVLNYFNKDKTLSEMIFDVIKDYPRYYLMLIRNKNGDFLALNYNKKALAPGLLPNIPIYRK